VRPWELATSAESCIDSGSADDTRTVRLPYKWCMGVYRGCIGGVQGVYRGFIGGVWVLRGCMPTTRARCVSLTVRSSCARDTLACSVRGGSGGSLVLASSGPPEIYILGRLDLGDLLS